MGDRANVVVYDPWADDANPKEAVFLYTHWRGTELPQTLKAALDKRWRWTDGSYLARIIFDEMTAGAYSGETGYGISTRLGDNEYPLLVVDVKRQVVVEYPEREYQRHGFAKLRDYPGVRFDEYTGRWTRNADDEEDDDR